MSTITKEQIETMREDLSDMVVGDTVWFFSIDNDHAQGRIRVRKDAVGRWVCYEHDPITGRTDGFGGEPFTQHRKALHWILHRYDRWHEKEAVA